MNVYFELQATIGSIFLVDFSRGYPLLPEIRSSRCLATNADVYAMGIVGMEVRWFSHHLLSNRCINHRAGETGEPVTQAERELMWLCETWCKERWRRWKSVSLDDRVAGFLLWRCYGHGYTCLTDFGEIGLFEICEMWLYHIYLFIYWSINYRPTYANVRWQCVRACVCVRKRSSAYENTYVHARELLNLI